MFLRFIHVIKSIIAFLLYVCTSVWTQEKQGNFRIPSASLTTLEPLTVFVVLTTTYGKFSKRCKYQTTLPASWETCMQVKKQQLEPDMKQQTGSKLRKEYVKAVYCHLDYLTHTQSTSCETLGQMKHKLESRLPGEISIISDIQLTSL